MSGSPQSHPQDHPQPPSQPPAAAEGHSRAREWDSGAGPEARGGSAAPGLVPTKTSVTLVRQEARLKRMKRSVLTSARLMQEEATDHGWRFRVAMLTLTYRPEAQWSARHITGLVKALRAYLDRRKVRARYVWVLELTQAGKPHYHLLIWLPRGMSLPKPDKRGWWPHGLTRIEWARSAVGYLAKYASKGTDGYAFPKGARLCGVGGLSLRSRLEKAWWLAPSWVREAFSIEERPVRAPGGGWVSRISGDWLPSPWRLVDRASDWSWARFESVPVPVTRALCPMGGTLEGSA